MMTRKAVYYLQYFNPAALPPLEHSALFFRRRGSQVFLSGIVEPDGSGRITVNEELAGDTRLWRAQRPGWRQKLHYLCFVSYHLWRMARAPRGWVYASDLLACPPALLAKWLGLGRLLYHEHDSPADPPEGKKGLEGFLLRLRRGVASSADVVVLPNEERARVFDRLRPGRPPTRVVWNCPRREEAGSARAPWDGRTLRLLYHGSIVPDRLPLSVLEALARFAGRVSLSVVGYFPLGWERYQWMLRDKAHELGIESVVEIKEAFPRAAMLAFASMHDVGLAFMPAYTLDINMRHMTGASNKAFDYLAVGAALLVSDLADWRAFYVAPGYALACDPAQADSVAAAVQRFLDDPVQMRAMGERGRQRILDGWNYETQLAPVAREMERLDTAEAPSAA